MSGKFGSGFGWVLVMALGVLVSLVELFLLVEPFSLLAVIIVVCGKQYCCQVESHAPPELGKFDGDLGVMASLMAGLFLDDAHLGSLISVFVFDCVVGGLHHQSPLYPMNMEILSMMRLGCCSLMGCPIQL